MHENVIVLNDSDDQVQIDVLTSFYLSDIYIDNFVKSLVALNDNISICWIVVVNSPAETTLNLLRNAIASTRLKTKLVLLDGVESIFSSYNRALRHSSSMLIAFYDMDDIRYPDSLLKQYNTLIKSNADASYGDIDIVYDYNGPIIDHYSRPSYSINTFLENSIWSPTQVYYSYVFELIGQFDEQYLTAGDYEHQCRFAKAGLTAVKTEGVLLKYLISNTPSKIHRQNQKVECIAIWDRYNLSHKYTSKDNIALYIESKKYNKRVILQNGKRDPISKYCVIPKTNLLATLANMFLSIFWHIFNSSKLILRHLRSYFLKFLHVYSLTK